MANDTHKQQGSRSASQSDEQSQKAVPYVPPPPPNESYQQRFKSPIVNGLLLSLVILFGGFITYNYVGHQLTQLSGATDVREVTPTPSVTPSVTEEAPTSSYTP